VKRLQFLEDGKLSNNENGCFKEVGDYVFHNSKTEQYAETGQTGYARAISNMFGNFRKEYKSIAESHQSQQTWYMETEDQQKTTPTTATAVQ
jgi:type IV secretory pathway TraG/TraD family ATPase VirD4